LSDLEVHKEFATLIEGNEDSFLRFFGTGNLRQLQIALKDIMSMPTDYRSTVANSAKAYARQHFDWAPIAREYARIYRTLLPEETKTVSQMVQPT
jgi:hypothetical protein